jgi:hypothetical protein
MLPFDTRVHLWQRGDAMSETQNQFSLTRVASIIGGAAKKQIPISKSAYTKTGVPGVVSVTIDNAIVLEAAL